MELRECIETAAAQLGSVKALADEIGMDADHVRKAKAGKRGLPSYACVKLAQLIHEDPTNVIAASELITETKEERRAVWLPFVKATQSKRAKRRAHHVP